MRCCAAVGLFQLETRRVCTRLIQRQHWRPAYFRVAADDINYRRFFNINELAGLRMELPELFDLAHRFVFESSATGRWTDCASITSTGCSIPRAICIRLREKRRAALLSRGREDPRAP